MPPLSARRRGKRAKGPEVADRLIRPAGGLEAEFSLFLDDTPVQPEQVFGDPRGFINVPLMHRTGKSFHLPNGAAVYFDTGVIEIATPVMELERGCFGRLARSLDAGIGIVRAELDGWERRAGRRARLQGFSTHYNVSVPGFDRSPALSRRLNQLAWVLAHVLPAPVIILATNRSSTGVGVRPRPRRIEITADFSPDPARIGATGAVVAGIVSAVSAWSDLGVDGLRGRGIPVVEGFTPMRHTTRKGWLARFDCYPSNPFACEPDAETWITTLGPASLRGMALRIVDVFDGSIRHVADPFSYRVARRIMSGRASSWLEAEQRPRTYDDVGRRMERLPAALRRLGLSCYERVVLNAVARRSLVLDGERWIPVAVRGWSRVVLRRARGGARRVLSLDALVEHVPGWD